MMTYMELYEKANRMLDRNKITLGEYEEMIKPLDAEVNTGQIKALPPTQPTQKKYSNVLDALDCISRQAAIEEIAFDEEMLRRVLDDMDVVGVEREKYEWGLGLIESLIYDIRELPSAQPEVIHCCDCIYYDPEHIEKNGVRYEYKDMPKDAFDILGTGLVTSEYGINVDGRCCRDYNVGYSEDKRVFVSKQNYCGRAWRRQDEQ